MPPPAETETQGRKAAVHGTHHPQRTPLRIAAGSDHTVLISDKGRIYGFGVSRFGELGDDVRHRHADSSASDKEEEEEEAAAQAQDYKKNKTKQKKKDDDDDDDDDDKNKQPGAPTREPHHAHMEAEQMALLSVTKPKELLIPHALSRARHHRDAKTHMQVSCGARHTAICVDGRVFVLGAKDQGGVGPHTHFRDNPDETSATSATEVIVPSGPGKRRKRNRPIVFVAAGTDHTIAVNDRGEAFAWGMLHWPIDQDASYRCHSVEPVPIPIPRAPLQAAQVIVEAACGSRHSLFLCASGCVYSFGMGQGGRLGHGSTRDVPKPKLIRAFLAVSGRDRIVQVAAGDAHSLALCAGGTVYAFGSGKYGRLGLGSDADQHTPAPIRFMGGKRHFITSVACGAFHSVAVAGKTREEEMENVTHSSLVQLGATNVAAGSGHVGSADSQVYTLFSWGNGKYGKLGLGHQRDVFTPLPVAHFADDNVTILRAVCGVHFTVAVSEREVYAWGYAPGFRCGVRLGRGTQATKGVSGVPVLTVPQLIPYFSKKSISRALASKARAEQAREGRRLLVGDAADNIGLGGKSVRTLQFAVGQAHVLAIGLGDASSTGAGRRSVLGWGDNSEGQLGVGDQSRVAIPLVIRLPLVAGDRVSHIACGGYHTVCVSENGHVFAWGRNSSGQLGHGHTHDVKRPLLVKSLQGTRVSTVYAGYNSSGAVELWAREDVTERHGGRLRKHKDTPRIARVFMWGSNTHGQLGVDGPAVMHTIPKRLQLAEGYAFQSILLALGETHTLLLGLDFARPVRGVISHMRDVMGVSLTARLALGEDGQRMNDAADEGVNAVADDFEGAANRHQIKYDIVRSRLFACGTGDRGQLGLGRRLNERVTTPALVRKFLMPGERAVDVPDFEEPEEWSNGEGEHSDEEDDYPEIVRIAAGRHTSLAVERGHLDLIYGWGKLPGLSNSPVFTPSMLTQFRDKQLQLLTNSQVPVVNFKIRSIDVCSNHILMVAELNLDRGRTSVVGVGSALSGRLGIGVVAEYVRDRPALFAKAARGPVDEAARDAIGDMMGEGDDQDAADAMSAITTRGVLPPVTLTALQGEMITHVACGPDFSVAFAQSTGVLFVWGSNVDGRLGVGGARHSRGGNDILEPTAMPYFGLGAGKAGVQTKRGGLFDTGSGDDSFDEAEEAAMAADPGQSVGMVVTGSAQPHGHRDVAEDTKDEEQDDRKAQLKKRLASATSAADQLTQAITPITTNMTTEDVEEAYAERFSAYTLMLDTMAEKKDLVHLAVQKRLQLAVNPLRDLASKDVPESKPLSPLEVLLSRLYMRPCLFYKVFKTFEEAVALTPGTQAVNKRNTRGLQAGGPSVAISATDAEGRERAEMFQISMYEAFGDLLFSVYDADRSADLRLLEMFVRLMLDGHCRACGGASQRILEPGSLVWTVFRRVFMQGKLFRQLSDVLAGPGSEAYPGSYKSKNAMRQRLYSLLRSRSSLEKVMGVAGWPLLALYDSLMKNRYSPDRLVDATVLRVLIEVMVEDKPFQAAKRAAREADAEGLIDEPWFDESVFAKRATGFRRLFGQLCPWFFSDEAAKAKARKKAMMRARRGDVLTEDEVKRRYEAEVRAKSTVDNAFDGLRATTRRNEQAEWAKATEVGSAVRLDGVVTYMQYISKTREAYGAHDFDELLLSDFLSIRTQYVRRVLQVRDDVCRWLTTHSEQLGLAMARTDASGPSSAAAAALATAKRKSQRGRDGGGGIYETELIRPGIKASDVDSVNVRLDPFHTDISSPVTKCSTCMLWHPFIEQLDADQRIAGRIGADDGDANAGEEHHGKHHGARLVRFSDEQCQTLWTVLSAPEFALVTQTIVGEAAWKEIIRLLSNQRKRALAAGNYDESHLYELTYNALHTIHVKDARVVFGSRSTAEIASNTVDPIMLFKRLKEISDRVDAEREMAGRKRAVLLRAVKQLDHVLESNRQQLAALEQLFAMITMSRTYEDIRDFIKSEIAPNMDKEEERDLMATVKIGIDQINVFKEKGLVRGYSYMELVQQGVLMPLGREQDPWVRQGGLAWCLPLLMYCGCGMGGVNAEGKYRFLSEVRFVFATTQRPDSIRLKMTYEPTRRWCGGGPCCGLCSMSEYQNPNTHAGDGGGKDIIVAREIDLPMLRDRLDYMIEYDPIGDRTPVTEMFRFVFDAPRLYQMLSSYPRPRATFATRSAAFSSGTPFTDAGMEDTLM